MANPLLIPAPLNRVRANVSFPSFQALNVTAPYLGEDGVSVTISGDTATQLMGLVSTVNSEEPYAIAQININLLKSLALANSWMAQIANTTSLGNVTVVSDTAAFPTLTFYNCVITRVGDVSMAGKQAAFQITISGFWAINNDLFTPV